MGIALPVFDDGNYPTIFAPRLLRLNRTSDGFVHFLYGEERHDEHGNAGIHVMLRLTRPVGALVVASQLIAETMDYNVLKIVGGMNPVGGVQ